MHGEDRAVALERLARRLASFSGAPDVVAVAEGDGVAGAAAGGVEERLDVAAPLLARVHVDRERRPLRRRPRPPRPSRPARRRRRPRARAAGASGRPCSRAAGRGSARRRGVAMATEILTGGRVRAPGPPMIIRGGGEPYVDPAARARAAARHPDRALAPTPWSWPGRWASASRSPSPLPSPSTFPEGPFTTVETGPVEDQRLGGLFAAHDVSVVQTLPSPRVAAHRRPPCAAAGRRPHRAARARGAGDRRPRPRRGRPLAGARDAGPPRGGRPRAVHERATARSLRRRGLAGGLLDARPGLPPLHQRIAVVPHGIDPASPPARPTSLRTQEIGADDRVAVWGGGMWSWLDPLTAIRAWSACATAAPT